MGDTRIGLIGCGRIAQLVHLPALLAIPGVRVTAVAEVDAQRRSEAMRRVPAASAYGDHSDLLAEADVEAVVVSVPPALHAEVAVAAFQAGKHVYLEKPLTSDLEDAATVIKAWHRAGTLGMIGFNYRFHPSILNIRRHLEAGTLGEPVGGRSVFSVMARTVPGWKRSRTTGGGVLLDLASHDLDLVHFLFGQKIVSVSALRQSRANEGDIAALQLQLESGIPFQCFFSMLSVEDHRLEVYGPKGRMTVDRTDGLNVQLKKSTMRHARLRRLRRGLDTLHPRLLLRSPGYEPSYAAAFKAFVDGVRSGAAGSPDLLDGYRSLAVVVAAEESARSGRTVVIEKSVYEGPARQ